MRAPSSQVTGSTCLRFKGNEAVRKGIAYCLYCTDLCGGVKVVFEHARHLNEAGIFAKVLSLTGYPHWLEYQVPFEQVDSWKAAEDYDLVVSTYFVLTLELWEMPGVRNRLVHFCQGFEGDYKEWQPMLDEIDRAYSLPLPIWSVSQSLTGKLARRYPGARIYTVGQGYDAGVFYPPLKPPGEPPVRVVLMGPYPVSIKEIPFGLRVMSELKGEFGERVETVRISPVDTRELEAKTYLADTYLWGLRPQEVAEVLRGSHVLFSPSNNGEGFGLPVLEAMACGCATCVSGIESYLSWDSPRDYALFFTVGGFQEAVEGLSRLVEDRGLRRALRRRGLQVSKRFSFHGVVDRIKAFLERY